MTETSQPVAKIFMHGRSQAVRLPKEFRLPGSEVFVRRQGDDVVLSTRPRASIQSLIAALDEFEPGHPVVREQPAAGAARAAVAPAATASAPLGKRRIGSTGG